MNLSEILKTRYENEQKIKESLENKAANLIAFIAIIVTIFTGFFSGILIMKINFWAHFFFWLGTIFYLTSGVFSLFTLRVRWGNAPLRITHEFIEEWRKSSITEKQLEEILQTDYLNAIEDLSQSNNSKAFFLHFGFLFAFLGVLFTVFLMAKITLLGQLSA